MKKETILKGLIKKKETDVFNGFSNPVNYVEIYLDSGNKFRAYSKNASFFCFCQLEQYIEVKVSFNDEYKNKYYSFVDFNDGYFFENKLGNLFVKDTFSKQLIKSKKLDLIKDFIDEFGLKERFVEFLFLSIFNKNDGVTEFFLDLLKRKKIIKYENYDFWTTLKTLNNIKFKKIVSKKIYYNTAVFKNDVLNNKNSNLKKYLINEKMYDFDFYGIEDFLEYKDIKSIINKKFPLIGNRNQKTLSSLIIKYPYKCEEIFSNVAMFSNLDYLFKYIDYLLNAKDFESFDFLTLFKNQLKDKFDEYISNLIDYVLFLKDKEKRTLLNDTVNQLQKIKGDVGEVSVSVEKFHDIVTKKFREQNFKERVIQLNYLKKYTFLNILDKDFNDLTWIIPETNRDVYFWGVYMDNCIYSRWRNNVLLLALKNKKGDLVYNMEIKVFDKKNSHKELYISEIKRRHNQKVEDQISKEIVSYLNKILKTYEVIENDSDNLKSLMKSTA